MRTKRAFKNLFFNLLQQISLILSNFIMQPIIISCFGSSVNGLVSSIKQLMSYVQLTGAGISASTTYAMYKPIANSDYRTLSGIYNATGKMFKKAGNIFSLITFIVAFIYPIIVESTQSFTTIFLLIIVMSISGASEFYSSGKLRSILIAHQHSFIVDLSQMCGNISTILVLLVLTHFNVNIIIVELGISFTYIFRIGILYYYVKKKYNYLDASVEPMYSEINQRGDAIVHQIAGLVVMGSSTLIISILLGLEEASIYAVYSVVFNGITIVCSSFSNTIYSSFGEIISKNEIDVLRSSYDIYEFIYFIMVSIVYSSTFILIMPFIRLYTSSMHDANYYLPVLALLCIIVGVGNNLRIPANSIITGAGHFKETKIYAIIEMIINLICQLIFGYLWGLYGIVFGSIISYAFRTIQTIYYTNKKIVHRTNKITIFRFLKNVIASIVLCIVLNNLITWNIQNYYEWFLTGCITFVLISSIVIAINFVTEKNNVIKCIKILRRIF